MFQDKKNLKSVATSLAIGATIGGAAFGILGNMLGYKAGISDGRKEVAEAFKEWAMFLLKGNGRLLESNLRGVLPEDGPVLETTSVKISMSPLNFGLTRDFLLQKHAAMSGAVKEFADCITDNADKKKIFDEIEWSFSVCDIDREAISGSPLTATAVGYPQLDRK